MLRKKQIETNRSNAFKDADKKYRIHEKDIDTVKKYQKQKVNSDNANELYRQRRTKSIMVKRDKIISVRVSSELLAEAQKRIDSYTKVYSGIGKQNWYSCNLPGSNITWGKFSMADLFEKALKDFVANMPINPGESSTFCGRFIVFCIWIIFEVTKFLYRQYLAILISLPDNPSVYKFYLRNPFFSNNFYLLIH